MRARAPFSYPLGTKRLACRVHLTSNGRLGCQQIMAYETDLLEYGDIFDGSHRSRARLRR